jgi:hypothetical protein
MSPETILKETKTKKNERVHKRQKASGDGLKPNRENGKDNGNAKKKKSRFSISHIAPWKIILGVILLGGLGILYLHHVFATQKLLSKVQNMEQQYQQAKRSHKKFRMEYDRLTGPAVITQKAKKMGLVDGGAAKKIIKIQPE